VNATLAALRPVPGFEGTAYGWWQGRLVWAGQTPTTDHPRNWARPWQPPAQRLSAARLRTAAAILLGDLKSGQGPLQAKGLLLWLCGQPLSFPMQPAQARFDAVRHALLTADLQAFEAAALRVLGLGPGLTPSGDDFLGALLFTLRHAPVPAWRGRMAAVHAGLLAAAATATNPISAALLQDLMRGRSYRALHELLQALQGGHAADVQHAAQALLGVGASSGADMLAGVLLALQPFDHSTPPCKP
jgi:Protein of unknown function (DUF2877)